MNPLAIVGVLSALSSIYGAHKSSQAMGEQNQMQQMMYEDALRQQELAEENRKKVQAMQAWRGGGSAGQEYESPLVRPPQMGSTSAPWMSGVLNALFSLYGGGIFGGGKEFSGNAAMAGMSGQDVTAAMAPYYQHWPRGG